MLGTPGPMVGQKTRAGDTYFDFLLEQHLVESKLPHSFVPFLKSASNDEKVLDSPGVEIPTFSITRYPYPEYHSSEDNLKIIGLNQVRESRNVLQNTINDLENDYIPKLRQPDPIFLSGYRLYPNWREDPELYDLCLSFGEIMPALDGKLSVLEIAKKANCSPKSVFYWCDKFHEKNLLEKSDFTLKRKTLTALASK